MIHIPDLALSLIRQNKLPEKDVPFVLKHLGRCSECMNKQVPKMKRPIDNMFELIMYEGQMSLLVPQEAALMVGYQASA